MKPSISSAAVLAVTMMAGAVSAETMPVDHSPAMPAVATSSTMPSSNLPAAGSNSFTQKQATERLTSKGYTGVSSLSKDDNGVWRGKAMLNGVKYNVAVDYQGNVTKN